MSTTTKGGKRRHAECSTAVMLPPQLPPKYVLHGVRFDIHLRDFWGYRVVPWAIIQDEHLFGDILLWRALHEAHKRGIHTHSFQAIYNVDPDTFVNRNPDLSDFMKKYTVEPSCGWGSAYTSYHLRTGITSMIETVVELVKTEHDNEEPIVVDASLFLRVEDWV